MKVESLSLPPGRKVSRVADAFDFTKQPRGLDLGKNGSEVPISRSGTCGIASVFEGHLMPVLPGAFLIRLRMKSSVQPAFLRHYINSPVGRPHVLQLAQGATHISGTRLRGFAIPLPPLPEQVEIAAAVKTINRKLESHRGKHKTAQNFFRTLLHKLMTAKIRLTDWN